MRHVVPRSLTSPFWLLRQMTVCSHNEEAPVLFRQQSCYVVIINKIDKVDLINVLWVSWRRWELRSRGWQGPFVCISAKTGQRIEDCLSSSFLSQR